MPGTGSAKLDETLELTAVAVEAGGDAALIITPSYVRPTQDALVEWYRTIAGEFPDLPIIAYNVPSRTAVDLVPETIARMYREIDNFVGVKETTKDFEHFSRVMQLCGSDLMMWSGIELLCLPLLAIGGAGFISATANLAPAAHADLYRAWLDGDQEAARRIHYWLHALVDLLFVETNPAPSKWVLQQMGAHRVKSRASAFARSKHCGDREDHRSARSGRGICVASRRRVVTLHNHLYIDGSWRAGETGSIFTVREPASGSELAEFAVASEADCAAAVSGSRGATGLGCNPTSRSRRNTM
jgi:4-hydroxy-tetrahydrodipicolinate synthase